MNYKKVNLYLGWVLFLISTTIFFITIEDTVSLWDCGEYITAAYKLEVGHPPGAPLFMVIGRLFSFFADPENVAVWINRLSAISSSGTILFMFWSITMLVKKMVLKDKKELSAGDKIAILASGFIGGLAYTFTESFWFSAVEGEVYAMSSLFTAIIFWAILKWDEEMAEIGNGLIPKGYSPDRWLLFIMFMLGLAIGVHLLGILIVPAIAYIIYFRFKDKITVKGFLLVGILAIVILGFIQVGVIQGSISMASKFEVAFVNSLGLPFFSGTIFFFVALVVICIIMIRYARRKSKRILYSSVMGLMLLLIGYGSFAVIVIRSNANTPLDENDPENLVTLHSYLSREQYGSAPILFGNHWNSTENPREDFKDLSAFHLRRFVVQKGDNILKAFKDENRAKEYAKDYPGAEVSETYFESNASTRKNAVATYAQTTFFPRMYWSQDQQRIDGYKRWSGYNANDGAATEKGSDGNRLPTFGENMTFFKSYQVNWMYWRYFMWNFSGRQNDIQGHGDNMRGNWISGFSVIDDNRLGDQDKAPYYTQENPSNNKFYLLPLILGFIGLIFHFYKAPKDAFVVMLVFLFTGLAIIIYLNPKPYEPRERDYAYAGSFFFFAMWIGIGVYALYDAFKSFTKEHFKKIGIIVGAGLFVMLLADMSSESSMPTTIAWLIISGIGVAVLALMTGLRKVLKKDVQGAIVAAILCLFVPLIMGLQGWDDHDRSLKTTADDLALNYLNSVEKNGILFTNGDNDTFPLWYMQEVEGRRVDVRVCNLSLMQTDWYSDQMKMRAYTSDPLPIKFTEDQILMYAGSTDQVVFTDVFELFYLNAPLETIKKVITLRVDANGAIIDQSVAALNGQATNLLNNSSASEPRAMSRLNQIKALFSTPLSKGDKGMQVFKKFQAGVEVLTAVQSGLITMTNENSQAFQTMLIDFEKSWNTSNLTDAMAFVRDDNNMVDFNGQRAVRVFPSAGFILPVNAKNAVKSGIIEAKDAKNCLKELKFSFTARAITREQVMMLDILANNDWERSICFSSPGGSDVSMALYRGGYIKQNGVIFELSPLSNINERFSADRMYNNLMKNYKFGAMSNPDVITDYYARRHTSQYRLQFLSLAEDFISKAYNAEEENSRREMMSSMGRDEATLPAVVPAAKIKEYKQKAKNLIHRSLEVMPADVVIDYGEPTQSNNPDDGYSVNGVSLPGYNDGVLHEYVGMLYMADDKAGAEKLGKIVADQLESIIGYFENSKIVLSSNNGNTKDLYAALSAYFKLHAASNDPELGNPNGALAKRTRAQVQYIYKTFFPSIIGQLKAAAQANGESVRRGSSAGRYANMMFDFEDYSNGMAIFFGFKEAPMQMPQQQQQQTPPPVMPSMMAP
jgi:hypothetical protein